MELRPPENASIGRRLPQSPLNVDGKAEEIAANQVGIISATDIDAWLTSSVVLGGLQAKDSRMPGIREQRQCESVNVTRPVEIYSWLANALSAERQALNEQMEANHRRLLQNFESRLGGFPAPSSDRIPPSRWAMTGALDTEVGVDIVMAGCLVEAELSQPNGMLNELCQDPLVPHEQGQDHPRCQANDAEVTKESDAAEPNSSSPSASRRANQLKSLSPAEDEPDMVCSAVSLKKKNISNHSITAQSIDAQNGDFIRRLVMSTYFESTFALFIVCNTVVMAAQVQYSGIQSGFILGYPGSNSSATVAWPGASEVFEMFELIFGLIFALEMLMKILGLRMKMFSSPWSLFDSFLVVFWGVDRFLGSGINPMMLRLFRLARLLRLVRLVRFMQAFAPLTLMVKAISGSCTVLFWSIVVLLLVQIAAAMFLSQALESFLTDKSVDVEVRYLVYSYFGSFSRATLSMFEVTLANWAPACRVLVNNVDEWYGAFFVLYKCSVGFSVINVIIGVFLHETFKIAQNDDEVMIMQKNTENATYHEKLFQLFTEADTSGDGLLTKAEFDNIAHNERVVSYMSALNVDIHELDALFMMMDEGDGKMDFHEFFSGVKRVKGPAKSIDVVHLLYDCQKLGKVLCDVDEKLDTLIGKQSSVAKIVTQSMNSLARSPYVEQKKREVVRFSGH